MKQEKKGLQLYKTALVISCVHFLLSFWTDHFSSGMWCLTSALRKIS